MLPRQRLLYSRTCSKLYLYTCICSEMTLLIMLCIVKRLVWAGDMIYKPERLVDSDVELHIVLARYVGLYV